MNGRGRSAKAIARELGLARNTVLRHLKSPESVKPQPRPLRGSKPDHYTEHIDQRLSEGLENCRVLLRKISALAYEGGYTTVADCVRPRRRGRQPQATLRFETAPGERAQLGWGSFSYVGDDGRQHRVWSFVMVLSWSRAIYAEFVRQADAASFIQCHANAFEYCGGVPRRCLYGNAKVVILGRNQDGRSEWNRRMLGFALRVGFEIRLCGPYRHRAKGRSRAAQVREGQHVARPKFHCRRWPEPPGAGMVRQCGQRLGAWDHSPSALGDAGRGASSLGELPGRNALAPFLRENRGVFKDSFVSWEESRYVAHAFVVTFEEIRDP